MKNKLKANLTFADTCSVEDMYKTGLQGIRFFLEDRPEIARKLEIQNLTENEQIEAVFARHS